MRRDTVLAGLRSIARRSLRVRLVVAAHKPWLRKDEQRVRCGGGGHRLSASGGNPNSVDSGRGLYFQLMTAFYRYGDEATGNAARPRLRSRRSIRRSSSRVRARALCVALLASRRPCRFGSRRFAVRPDTSGTPAGTRCSISNPDRHPLRQPYPGVDRINVGQPLRGSRRRWTR